MENRKPCLVQRFSGYRLIILFLAVAWLIPTRAQSTNSGISWNNITASIGSSSSAKLSNLLTSRGAASAVTFQMLARFNAADQNGTLSSKNFPASATRDSLFGNTEPVSGLANVTPSFKITGFSADTFSCNFTFYASRMGASGNLQTRYTVTGTSTAFADLDPANNIDGVVYVTAQPDASGSITVSITPGPANNSPNHLTFLGAIRIATLSDRGSANYYFDFGADTSQTGGLAFLTFTPKSTSPPSAILRLDGAENVSYRLESSTNLLDWQPFQNFPLTNGFGSIEIEMTGPNLFLRAVQ
jgi:hypothetical protein